MADIYSNLQNLIDNTLELLEKYKKATDDFLALADTTTNAKIAEINSTAAARLKDIDNKADEILGELETLELGNRAIPEPEWKRLALHARRHFAGNGFIKWGDVNPSATARVVNQGMYAYPAPYYPNSFFLGYKFAPLMNINGYIFKIQNTNWSAVKMSKISLSDPIKVVTNITDTTATTFDIKQGDFIILNDTNRELVSNGIFTNDTSGWVDRPNYGILSYDSTNQRAVVTRGEDDLYNNPILESTLGNIKYIEGVDYLLKVDITNGDGAVSLSSVKIFVRGSTSDFANNKIYYPYKQEGNTFYFKFRPPTSNGVILIQGEYDSNNQCFYDNISVTQIEETPVIALRDMSVNGDLYDDSVAKNLAGRETVSRTDLVFIEQWKEDITNKDVVYPYGNVQYKGIGVEGLPDPLTADWFDGADTYSLYGNWQKPGELIGKGYRWSTLTEEQKLALASNPLHHIVLEDDGRWTQRRFRIRVVTGLGNDWNTVDVNYKDGGWLRFFGYPYSILPKGSATNIANDYLVYKSGVNFFTTYTSGYHFTTWYSKFKYPTITDNIYTYPGNVQAAASPANGNQVFLVPLALVQRYNEGVWHPIYNPTGRARGYDKDAGEMMEIEEYIFDNSKYATIADCFDPDKIAALTEDGSIIPASDSSASVRTGYMKSGITGYIRGDYCDHVARDDIRDLRMSAIRKERYEILDEEYEKDVKGSRRGIEGERTIKSPTYLLLNARGDYVNVEYISIGKVNNKYATRLFVSGTANLWDFLEDLAPEEGRAHCYVDGPFGYVEGDSGKLYDVVAIEIYGVNRILYINPLHGDVTSDFVGYNQDHINFSRVKFYPLTPRRDKHYYDMVMFEIYGDYRPLKDRVEYTTVSGDDQTATINKNTYVLADGTYYRSLVDRGEITIDPDTEDYTNTDNWVNLGTDGDIGGFPAEWIESNSRTRMSFFPRMCDEECNPMRLVDLNTTTSGQLIIKLARRSLVDYAIFIAKKDGTWVKATYGVDNEYNGGIWDTNNFRYINVENFYSDYGYASVQEFRDFGKVMIIYDTRPTALFKDAKRESVYFDNAVYGITYQSTSAGGLIPQMLFKKVSVSTTDDGGIYATAKNYRKEYWNIGEVDELYNNSIGIRHDPIEFASKRNPAVKYLRHLTNYNMRIRLTYYYTEMKYDSTADSYGDLGYIRPIYSVNSYNDLNGNNIMSGISSADTPYYAAPEDLNYDEEI